MLRRRNQHRVAAFVRSTIPTDGAHSKLRRCGDFGVVLFGNVYAGRMMRFYRYRIVNDRLIFIFLRPILIGD